MPEIQISSTLLNPPIYNGVTVKGECVAFADNYAAQVLGCPIPGIDQYHPYNKMDNVASDGAHWIWDDVSPVDGHNRLQPANTDRIANDGSSNFPQAQDIMVWGTGVGSGYGHIAIVDVANSRNDVWVIDSNWSTTDDQLGRRRHITIDSYIDGWYRKKGSSSGGFDPTNPYVDSSYLGTEVGTQAQPFKTISAAVSAASALPQAVTMHVKGGHYPGPITISNKNIHIISSDGNTVTIGG